MKKLIFVIAVLISGLAVAAGYTLKDINQSWQTICEIGGSNMPRAVFIIANTGDNPLTDCKIEKWTGSWTEIEAWPECQSLASKAKLRKDITGNDGTRLRLQAVSDSGTQGWCLVDYRSPFVLGE